MTTRAVLTFSETAPFYFNPEYNNIMDSKNLRREWNKSKGSGNFQSGEESADGFKHPITFIYWFGGKLTVPPCQAPLLFPLF